MAGAFMTRAFMAGAFMAGAFMPGALTESNQKEAIAAEFFIQVVVMS